MTTNQWAPVMRLYDLHAQAKTDSLKNAIEDAIDRELNAIQAGSARRGGVATAIDNHRRRERRRHQLETAIVPVMPTMIDPWPEVHRRLDLVHALEGVHPAFRTVLLMRALGLTFEEISQLEGEPIGTLKSRMSRAMAKIAA